MKVLLSKKVHKKLMGVVERTFRNKEEDTLVYLLGADEKGLILDCHTVRRVLRLGGCGCEEMPRLNTTSLHKAANVLINKGLNPVGLARVHYDFEAGNGDFGTPLRCWKFVMTVSRFVLCVTFTTKDGKHYDGDRVYRNVEVV